MHYGSRTGLTILPPPRDGSPTASGTTCGPPYESLRVVTARALAEQARVAFEEHDATMFDGAVTALVELVAAPGTRQRRS
jgi:hypothetical protein